MTAKKTAKAKAPAHIGRPRASEDDGPSVVVRARVGTARAQKFHALGGPAWLREQIDRARLPAGASTS